MGLAEPTTDVELLERSSFVRDLGDWLDRAARGDGGRLVLVVGEAGVGKTALLRQFCAERSESARVLFGASEGLQTAARNGLPLDRITEVRVLEPHPHVSTGIARISNLDGTGIDRADPHALRVRAR